MPVETEFEGLSPEEAIRYFRRKEVLPSKRWSDYLGAEHDRAFVVAGGMKMQLLEGLRGAVDKALADGESLADFRKRFDEVVAKTGWDHKGKRGWRSALIYRQNLQSAYAAGRYEQMTDEETLEERPYWLYRHGGSADPRPDHVQWDGLVLAASDPWWQTHYPPNGYGCSCSAFALDEEAVERRKLKIADKAPKSELVDHRRRNPKTGRMETIRAPEGVHPGFAAAPGESWKRRFTPSLNPADWDPDEWRPPAVTPAPRQAPGPMPEPATIADDVRILPEGDAEGAVAAFMRRFGRELDDPDYIHKDLLGERIPVSQYMFRHPPLAESGERKWKLVDGPYKSREKWLEYLAEAIKDPDEIRVHMEPVRSEIKRGKQKYVTRRYYLRRVEFPEEGENGVTRLFYVIYSHTRGQLEWDIQVTAHRLRDKAMAAKRRGLLLYSRPEKRP